jgi:hypothetical protein
MLDVFLQSGTVVGYFGDWSLRGHFHQIGTSLQPFKALLFNKNSSVHTEKSVSAAMKNVTCHLVN